MIYTLTLNPSIDYVAVLPEFQEGKMNLIEEAHFYAGGKGINVSRVLHSLHVPSVAMGLVAGFTGDYIERCLTEEGLAVDFVHMQGECSRINFKMKGKCETECNGKGPEVDALALEELRTKLNQIQSGDTLVLSGSIPSSIQSNVYRTIMQDLSDRDVRVVLDARNTLVLECLDLKPWLLKPNLEELQEMFEVPIRTREEIVYYANELRKRGAKNVLVSEGKDGALFCGEDDKVYVQSALSGKVRNTTGAGDSMVAGFLYGLIEKPDQFAHALKFAVAAGSATAFQDDLATGKMIQEVYMNM